MLLQHLNCCECNEVFLAHHFSRCEFKCLCIWFTRTPRSSFFSFFFTIVCLFIFCRGGDAAHWDAMGTLLQTHRCWPPGQSTSSCRVSDPDTQAWCFTLLNPVRQGARNYSQPNWAMYINMYMTLIAKSGVCLWLHPFGPLKMLKKWNYHGSKLG